MELYNKVLKLFLSRKVYIQYHKVLDYKRIKDTNIYLYRLFSILGKIYEDQNKESITPGELEALYLSSYPAKDADAIRGIIASVEEATPTQAIEDYLVVLLQRTKAEQLAIQALSVSSGAADPSVLRPLCDSFVSGDAGRLGRLHSLSTDLTLLANDRVARPGLRWRLDCLNKSLGPIRKGDFGFIFARPESGKTTFLASEVSHMLTQLSEDSGPCLWFNNEEQGSKVIFRIYSGLLGAPQQELLKYPDRASRAFAARTKNKLMFFDEARIQASDIEAICDREKPSLIVIDQLDKVTGFSGERSDLELGKIYIWAREIAKMYAPVIGVTQAQGEAGGVKYLTMEHVANAKTSKQAEADWMLGIGYDPEGPEAIRGLSICKNKLEGDEHTNAMLRHGRFDVVINPAIARYSDTMQA